MQAILSILPVLAPFIAKLGLYLLDKFISAGNENAAAREAFLSLVKTMQGAGMISLKLADSYRSQQDRNREELGLPPKK